MSLNKEERQFLYKFLAVIILIVCINVFSGCVATKKQRERFLRENCVVASSTETKDSTARKETLTADTVYRSVPGPIRYFPSPCEKLCDSLGNLKPFKEESRKNGIRQSLETVGNVLVQKCDVDSLLDVNEKLTIEIEHFRSIKIKEQVHENCKLQHITNKDIFWRMIGIRLSIILAIYIALRIFKVYLNRVPWLAWLAKFII